MRKLAPVLFSISLLAGCHFPAASLSEATHLAPLRAVAPLAGRVRFESHAVQVSISEMVDATVSLIDAATGRTVTTALTDSQGNFVLNFAAGFSADPAATYYLEAIKGLNGNLPGHPAVRVRTIVRYADGWTSLTNTKPNDGILISPSTTALSIGAALRNHASPYPMQGLIGKLGGMNFDQFFGQGVLTAQDFTALRSLVDAILASDQDPIRSIGLYGASTWGRLNQALSATSFTPGEGWPGMSATLNGTGFDLNPGQTTLRIGGAVATASVVSPAAIQFQLPDLALPIQASSSAGATLKVGETTFIAPSFTYVPGFSLVAGKYHGYAYEGDGGPATDAKFNNIANLTVDPAGNILVADMSNGRIRKIDKASGTISTLVSGLNSPTDVKVEADGNVLIVENGSPGFVKRWDKNTQQVSTVVGSGSSSPNGGDGGPATDAYLHNPRSIALDQGDNLYVTEPTKVRRVDKQTGTISTIVSGMAGIQGMALDRAGNAYFTTSADHLVRRWDQSTLSVTTYAGGGNPPSGFGDGGLATNAKFNMPTSLAMDLEDNLFIAELMNDGDPQGRIRRVDKATGVITRIAGGLGVERFQFMPGTTVKATTAVVYRPTGIAFGPDGTLYFTDLFQQVLKVR